MPISQLTAQFTSDLVLRDCTLLVSMTVYVLPVTVTIKCVHVDFFSFVAFYAPCAIRFCHLSITYLLVGP